MITDLDPSATNGYSPTNVFYPVTHLSNTLLGTIVTKTRGWLERLGQKPTGEFGYLRWNYTPENGTIIFENSGASEFVQLWWNSDWQKNEISACASVPQIQEIEVNLEYFRNLELAIYTELEKLQEEIYASTSTQLFYSLDETGNISTPPADLVQPEETLPGTIE